MAFVAGRDRLLEVLVLGRDDVVGRLALVGVVAPAGLVVASPILTDLDLSRQ